MPFGLVVTTPVTIDGGSRPDRRLVDAQSALAAQAIAAFQETAWLRARPIGVTLRTDTNLMLYRDRPALYVPALVEPETFLRVTDHLAREREEAVRPDPDAVDRLREALLVEVNAHAVGALSDGTHPTDLGRAVMAVASMEASEAMARLLPPLLGLDTRTGLVAAVRGEDAVGSRNEKAREIYSQLVAVVTGR